jgi:arylsulfatase
MPGKNGHPGGYAEVDVPMALYDLAHDPGETLDVQNANAGVLKEMLDLADKYRKTLGDDITHTPCTECREAAKVNK